MRVRARDREMGLTKTLDFQLDIRSDNEELLYEATHQARKVYNEAIRLAKDGVPRRTIPDRVTGNSKLVKNTTQRIVAKALGAVDNYQKYDDYGEPSHSKAGSYPLRSNYEEGYDLSLRDDGTVEFRISAKPYKHVTGVLKGDEVHLDTIRDALDSDGWSIGTSEVLVSKGTPELHVDITNTDKRVRDKGNSRTVVGVDVNEDNVALTALSEEGIQDTLVIEYPDIKFERHHYFTIRKRVQKVGKESIHRTLEGREKAYVRDRLHKVSRHVVDWCQQFEKPCILFEDLKEMRDSIDYGTRMNRRLHHLPFRALQFYTSYKAAFEGVPTAWIEPEYTSQRCPLCGHTERANRNKKRFKCRECSHQDHSDRGASVNVAVKGIERCQDWNVPALNSLPEVRTVRRQASGAVDAPTVTHEADRSHHTDGFVGVSE